VIQNRHYVGCDMVAGLCGGNAYLFRKRYGCASSQNGSCTTDIFPRYDKWVCINDLPGGCDVLSPATTYYMLACG
jgi:hypothetical protein